MRSGWQRFVLYVAADVAWTSVFAGLMLVFFGRLLPPVYQGGLSFPHQFVFRILGILFSPSRGLLVFVPVLLVPLYLTFRYWQGLPQRHLAILALVALAYHIVLTASWDAWGKVLKLVEN